MRLARHPHLATLRAKAEFREHRGLASTVARAHAIARLPSKVWRGVRVYEVRCCGDFGRGPHLQFLPAGHLWALIDIRRHRCPWHRI